MKKRILTLTLVLAMCLSLFPVTVFAATFTDVPESHWAHDAVEYLYSKGFVVPLEDGRFKPDSLPSRAEMAVQVCRAMGVVFPNKEPVVPIADIYPTTWYTSNANHAVAEGWMKVDGNGHFRPNAALTRQEIALAVAPIMDAFDPNEDYSSYVSHFKDFGAIDEAYINAVGFLFHVGIMAGFADEIRPDQTVTRAEMAVILYRALTSAESDGDTHTVTLTITKDGLPWADHGKTFAAWIYKDNASSQTRTGIVNGATVTFADIPGDCSFYIYDTVTYDGFSGAVDDTDVSVSRDYYTVAFTAVGAGYSSGGRIDAWWGYRRSPLSSGDAVLAGERITLSAAGEGASLYTFSWSDNAEIQSNTRTVENLRAPLDLTCTITGVNVNKVTAIAVMSQPNKLDYFESNPLSLTGLTVDLTFNDGSTVTGVAYQNFPQYGILAAIDGAPVLHNYTHASSAHHNKPITLSAGTVTAETDLITLACRIEYYPNSSGSQLGTVWDTIVYGAPYTVRDNMFTPPMNYVFDGWGNYNGDLSYLPGDTINSVTGMIGMYVRWRDASLPPSTLAIAPETWSPAAGSGSTTVTVTSDTSWTVRSEVPWLGVYPYNGTGDGTVTLNVAANNTGAARTGTVTVTSGTLKRTVTVTQAAGGGGDSTVTAMTIATQPDKLTYHVNTPLRLTGLTAHLTFSDGTTISGVSYQDFDQYDILMAIDGAPYTSNFPIAPKHHGKPIVLSSGMIMTETNPIMVLCEVTYHPNGGTGALDQKDYPNCGEDYVLHDNMFTPPVNYIFDAWQDESSDTYYRAGDIWNSSVPTFLDMYARWRRNDPSATLEITPDTWNAPTGAANTVLSVTSNTSRIATSNKAWLTVSPAYAVGNGNLTLNAAANTTGVARTGTITVTAGAIEKTITVTQAAAETPVDPILDVTPAVWSPAATAANTAVNVTSDAAWTAGSDNAWLTVLPAAGNGNGTLTLNVAANTGAARTGTITVTAGTIKKTITVTQAAGGGSSGGPPMGGSGGNPPAPVEVIPNPTIPPLAVFPFEDVHADDWYYDDVYYAWEKELFNGTSATTFDPLDSMTRGMIVTILYRLDGSPDVSERDNPFDDVPEGQYYTDAVKWAAANEIVFGYGNGNFVPEGNVTRQDFAVILARFADYAGKKLPETRTYSLFRDDADIANYAKDAVAEFFKAGVLNGKPNNKFDPQGNVTRAEAAAMLHRVMEASKEP